MPRPRAKTLRMRTHLLLCLLLCAVGCDDDDPTGTAPDGAVTPDAGEPPTDMGGPAGDEGPGPDAEAPGVAGNFGVEETEGRPECDNLLETHCLMPFPSDRFLVRDGDARSVLFDDAAMPIDNRERPIRGDAVASADGWGIATPPILYWPGATPLGAAPVFQPQASLAADSKTVIIDAERGTRVAHWVETDYLTAEADALNIVLRTAAPFEHDRRYIVAVRGLVDEAGAVLEAPPGFAALRDGTASTRVGVHARRQRFEDEVFAPLTAHGVERDDLQLAWDFTTGTYENATGLLVGMRDAMLEAVGPDGPEYTIDSVEAIEHPHIAVMAHLTVHIPSFLLEPTELSLRRIRRDAEGKPKIEGFEDWPMTLQIPHSVLDDEAPGGVLQYGHGFLGSLRQGNGSWLRSMAFDHRFLIIATDMQGMSEVDSAYWGGNLVADPASFPTVTEKALQGILNQVMMQRMMRGRFLAEAHPLLTRGGAPLYHPDDVWYYGNSQGGTIGSVVMAVTPEVTRGVLGVPGCCYPVLVHRSTVFIDFIGLLELAMPDPTDLGIMLGLFGGTGMRYIDPINYAPAIVHAPFPQTPRHEVLLHVAKEDAQVHNEVSYILGRAIDVPLITPPLRPVWGFEEAPYPHEGSGLVEYDFSVPDNPDPLLPPPDEWDTHGSLRKQTEAQDQMMQFLKTGVLNDTCGGPCVFPERP